MKALVLLGALLATPAGAAAAAEGAPAAAPSLQVVEGQIARAEFQAVIDRGPQRLVAAVVVEPALQGRRFLGFRIVAFTPDGPLASTRSLQPGDVLVRANRESLERPEQFMHAWEVVKASDAVEIEVLRGDQRLLYRWKIVP